MIFVAYLQIFSKIVDFHSRWFPGRVRDGPIFIANSTCCTIHFETSETYDPNIRTQVLVTFNDLW